VGTALLGADWSTARWQTGAALSQSWASGSYAAAADDAVDGKISTTLMGALLSLSTTADLLTIKTTSDAVDGLPSSQGSVSRLRLGLEVVRPVPLTNGHIDV